jgi:hypothetical protein
LIELGLPFVEVSLAGSPAGSLGWDTHANNFAAVKRFARNSMPVGQRGSTI